MMRRGISLVIEYMLLSTATKTKIGIALSAIASGVTNSPRKRYLLSAKLIATPNTVPAMRPTNALVPETEDASQIRAKFLKNCSKIFEGAARKYGLRSNPLTTPSHNNKNETPKTSGGKIRRMRDTEFMISDLQLREQRLHLHVRRVCHEVLHALQ